MGISRVYECSRIIVVVRRLAIGLAAVVLIGWALVPLVRGLLLVGRGASPSPVVVDMPREIVTFNAADDIRLSGSFFPASGAKAAVVLVHGFKNTQADMLAHAEFLHAAGYAVLTYDSRGCGASDGIFGVGATEVRDVVGAVNYVHDRGFTRIAVLGVSLGAGDALLAAARDPDIGAVVADSAWADERVQIDRMLTLAVGPLRIPLVPYEPALIDTLVGGRLEDARPRDEVVRIAPRPVLFIHSADDQNATTSLEDARLMFASAGDPKEMWIAPSGGHAGAFGANRQEYVRRVTDFLARALG